MNQRWNRRRDSYRPPAEPIDPSRYGVALVERDREARAFVEAHHYAASYPAARARVGLYRMRGPTLSELVGVAVFSVPMSNAVVPKWMPGLDGDAGVELGRLVLLDDVEGNGESWFLARAFRLLRGELPGVRGVVSFSDPMQRKTEAGHLVMPGHVGTVYQALNGRHVGRTRPRWLHLDRAGRVVSDRALSKIRNDERGAAYAYRDLLASGAPLRQPFEEGAAYVARALAEGPFRRVRHPGNFAYTWPLGETTAAPLKALPFPKVATDIQPAA